MFESVFETTTASISASEAAICIGTALGLGLLLSLIYIFSSKEKKFSTNFAITLILIPAITALVIMLIGSDIAKALSLGGVFALVRFRSVPGDSKDISSIFLAMAIGLSCGMGFVTLAVVAAFGIGIIYFLLVKFGYGEKKGNIKELKVTIPENLNYFGAFDDLFEEYTDGAELIRVKTVNLGTLYQLTYSITEKKGIDEKKFLDSLRCRNGNLNITLGMMPEKETL